MNGDWNPSNNLKKICSDFTLAIGVQKEMGLGIFRDLDIEENPSFSTPPPCLQVFGFHFGNQSKERKGLWIWGFLGILR